MIFDPRAPIIITDELARFTIIPNDIEYSLRELPDIILLDILASLPSHEYDFTLCTGGVLGAALTLAFFFVGLAVAGKVPQIANTPNMATIEVIVLELIIAVSFPINVWIR